LQQVVKGGQPIADPPSIHDTRDYCLQRAAELPDGVRRLRDWEHYPVTVSAALETLTQGIGHSREEG